jgi:four helix bundle protein
MGHFRFEDLEIWKLATNISNELFDLADMLHEKKKFRFAEQLYAAAMSITNNIAEGSGSFSNADFANFLKFSRRSVFECANITAILHSRNYIDVAKKNDLFSELIKLSSMITNFRKNLLNRKIK